nr:glycosyltransferase family 2 protein [Candidatus Magasanikbacteria bacterium]
MLFSVIIPTNHRTRGITHALSSLMLQTHPHWEAIIVDNELEEKNTSHIHSLQSEDKRIRYLKKPYRNLSEARAWGISAARGDIITFIEGNDYFSPTHLQTHHDFFTSNPRLDMLLGKPTIVGSPYIENTHVHQTPVHGTFFIREHVFDTIQQ